MVRNSVNLLLIVASCLGAFMFYRFILPFDSSFRGEFERFSGTELSNDSIVIRSWSNNKIFYRAISVTAALKNSGFEPNNVLDSMETQTSCFENSGGAKQFLTESSDLQCWAWASRRKAGSWVYILFAEKENILLYKGSGRLVPNKPATDKLTVQQNLAIARTSHSVNQSLRQA